VRRILDADPALAILDLVVSWCFPFPFP